MEGTQCSSDTTTQTATIDTTKIKPTFEEVYIKEEPQEENTQDVIDAKCNKNKKKETNCANNGSEFVDAFNNQTDKDDNNVNDKTNNLKCNICNKTFSHKSNLNRHLQIHSAGKGIECPTCNKVFLTKNYLIKHMQTHSGVKEFQCSQCDKSFLRKESLLSHEKTHKGIKDIKCPICGMLYSHRSNLSTHLKRHNAAKELECGICHKVLSSKTSLNLHLKVHSGVREFKCFVCSKLFSTTSNLKQHMKTHDRKKRDYECGICKSVYKDEFHLNKHMEDHREENSNLINNTTTNIQKTLHTNISSPESQLKPTNKVIISPHNSKTTLSENIVQNQTDNTETEHSFEDIYIKNEPHETYLSHCEVKMEDEKEITIEEEVVNHSNQDRQIYETLLQETQVNFDSSSSSSTVYQTETTQYDVASTRNQLQTEGSTSSIELHDNINLDQLEMQREESVATYLLNKLEQIYKDIHNFEIPKKCPFCDEIFPQFSPKMKQHIKSHIGTGKKYCSTCDKSFTKKVSFKNHMSYHLGIIETYQCPLCPKSYTDIYNLRRHMRSQDSVHLKTLRAGCLKNKRTINISKDSSTFTIENNLVFHLDKHEEPSFDSNSSTNTEHQPEILQQEETTTTILRPDLGVQLHTNINQLQTEGTIAGNQLQRDNNIINQLQIDVTKLGSDLGVQLRKDKTPTSFQLHTNINQLQTEGTIARNKLQRGNDIVNQLQIDVTKLGTDLGAQLQKDETTTSFQLHTNINQLQTEGTIAENQLQRDNDAVNQLQIDVTNLRTDLGAQLYKDEAPTSFQLHTTTNQLQTEGTIAGNQVQRDNNIVNQLQIDVTMLGTDLGVQLQKDEAPTSSQMNKIEKIDSKEDNRSNSECRKCPICNEIFTNATELDKHVKKYKNMKKLSIHDTYYKSTQCPICDKVLQSNWYAFHHLQTTHIGIKPFQCSKCKKSYTTKNSLEFHMSTHTGSRNYKCTVCDKSYRCNNFLRQHMRDNGDADHLKALKEMKRRIMGSSEDKDSTGQKFEEIYIKSEPQDEYISDSGKNRLHEHNMSLETQLQTDNKDLSPQLHTNILCDRIQLQSQSSILEAQLNINKATLGFNLHTNNANLGTQLQSDNVNQLQVDVTNLKTNLGVQLQKDEATTGFQLHTNINQLQTEGTMAGNQLQIDRTKLGTDLGVQLQKDETITGFQLHTTINQLQTEGTMTGNQLQRDNNIVNQLQIDGTNLRTDLGVQLQKDKTPTGFQLHTEGTMARNQLQRDINIVNQLQIDGTKLKTDLGVQLQKNEATTSSQLNKNEEIDLKKDNEHSKSRMCPICTEIFTNATDLDKHVKKYKDIKNLSYNVNNFKSRQCPICDKVLQKKWYVFRHIQTSHIGIKSFQCSKCDKCFTTKDSLKFHMTKHSGERNYKCLACHKSYQSSGILKRHMIRLGDDDHLNVLKNMKKVKDNVQKEQKYEESSRKCPLCTEKFTNATDLEQHMKKYRNIKKLTFNEGFYMSKKCPVCDKMFKQESNIVRHVKTAHIGLKNFNCADCKKSFTSKESLDFHLTTHTRVKNYSCPVCHKKYTTKNILRQHMRNTDYMHLEELEKMKNNDSNLNLTSQNSTTLSETIAQKQSENTETKHGFQVVYIKNEPHEEYLSHCEVKMENEKEITIKEEIVNHSNQDRQIYESLLQKRSNK